jgi:hypothetical protein
MMDRESTGGWRAMLGVLYYRRHPAQVAIHTPLRMHVIRYLMQITDTIV